MNDKNATIAALRDMAVAFRDARDWKQFHAPKDLVSAIGIEVAELAELFLWKRNKKIEQELTDPDFRKRVEEEMADVQILLLSLSAITGVDLSRAVESKMEQNAKKYPLDKAYGIAAKYTDLK